MARYTWKEIKQIQADTIEEFKGKTINHLLYDCGMAGIKTGEYTDKNGNTYTVYVLGESIKTLGGADVVVFKVATYCGVVI